MPKPGRLRESPSNAGRLSVGYGSLIQRLDQPPHRVGAECFGDQINQHGGDRAFTRFGDQVQPVVQPFGIGAFDPGFYAVFAGCQDVDIVEVTDSSSVSPIPKNPVKLSVLRGFFVSVASASSVTEWSEMDWVLTPLVQTTSVIAAFVVFVRVIDTSPMRDGVLI
ncbi:hypothetical protein Pla100_47090 [Neorhodopirellula pilleata]|uniref:Uncharacterized protein n=1 Tax=Neorhodopirellula pilleata TaxID=2714738 RepID=A0A5C6A0V3_9BACT|nr:hypothetical protein Pla100_47090 [Neorhodopirellula pilleata]